MSGADRHGPRHVPGTPAPSLVGNCIRGPGDPGRLIASTAVWGVRRWFQVGHELAATTSPGGRTPCLLFRPGPGSAPLGSSPPVVTRDNPTRRPGDAGSIDGEAAAALAV